MLKLLHVIGSMNPLGGGVCQALRTFIPCLQEMGFDNTVVSLDEQKCDWNTVDSFVLHKLGSHGKRWGFSPTLASWLTKHLIDFDATIVHGLWQFHSAATTRAIKKLRNESGHVPRMFVMPHGMLDPWFQQHFSRRLKAIRNTIYWHLVERHTIEEADGLLFTCEQELLLARKTFAAYRPRAEFNVGLGVAEPPAKTDAMLTAFSSVCPQVGTEPYLLFLSRIHPKKGVDLLIRAYSHLAVDSNVSKLLPILVIAGPTDSPYAESMIQLARKSGLLLENSVQSHGPGIVFSGMLNGDAKWGAFHGCEAFVLPSHQENFGIAVVEALACAKPVLISNQVNIYSDLLEDHSALVEPDTLTGTIQLLQSWFCLPAQERCCLESSSRTCYEKRYLPNAAARRLLAVLQG